MRRLSALLGTALMLAAAAGPVAADAAYRTERLELLAETGAQGGGFIVNIHPNGPQVFALERYALRGALPRTTYDVRLVIDGAQALCGFPIQIPMASGTTNSSGNLTLRGMVLRPAGIPECLRGETFAIHWEVRAAGVLTHTASTVVTLD
jgi:hypothetical protein